MHLIVCETVAAITTHAREVTPDNPISYNGSNGKTMTLCGSKVGWDLQYDDVGMTRCRDCIELLRLVEYSELDAY